MAIKHYESCAFCFIAFIDVLTWIIIIFESGTV